MLKKFDELYSKLVFEMSNKDIEVISDKDVDKLYLPKYQSSINRTDEFFNHYIKNNMIKNHIFAGKDGENYFVFFGFLKNIISFLKSFKVDDLYMEKPEEFKMFSPMYTFDDDNYAELLHNGNPNYFSGEYFPPESFNAQCLNDYCNIIRRIPRGRWYSFKNIIQNNEDKTAAVIANVKDVTPKELISYLDEIKKQRGEDTVLLVKVGVNCEGLTNINYDQQSYTITEARMNENSYADLTDGNGNLVFGEDFTGRTVKWKFGPTNEKTTVDFLTGEKLPWMATIFWLPNAKGRNKGITIGYESYNKAIADNDEEKIEKLKSINFPLNINI